MGGIVNRYVGNPVVRMTTDSFSTREPEKKGGIPFMKRKIKDVCGKHRRKDDFDDFDRDIDVFDLDEFDSEPEEVSSSKPVSLIPEEVPPEESVAPAPAPKPAPKPAEKPAEEPAPVAEPAPVVRPEPKSAPRPAPKPAAKPAPAPSSSDDEPYRRPPTPSFAPRMATRTPTYPETDQQVVALFRSLQSKNAAYGAGIFVDDYGRILPINLMSLSPEMLEIHEIIEEHYYAPAVRKNVAPFWSKLPGMSYAMSIQSILKAREDFGWNPGRLSLTDKNCHFYVLTSDGKVDLAATKERPVTDAEIEAWKNANLDLLAKLG